MSPMVTLGLFLQNHFWIFGISSFGIFEFSFFSRVGGPTPPGLEVAYPHVAYCKQNKQNKKTIALARTGRISILSPSVTLFYKTNIRESLLSRGFFLSTDLRQPGGSRILTLHINYVADYTSPLLFLFERTHNYLFDDQGLLPWWLRCLGESKVRSALLVRVTVGNGDCHVAHATANNLTSHLN